MSSTHAGTRPTWMPRARLLVGRPAQWHPPIRLIGLLDQLVGRLAVA